MRLSLRSRLEDRNVGAFITWQVASVALVYLVPSLIRLETAPFMRGVGDAFQAWVWASCFLLLSLLWHILSTWHASGDRRAVTSVLAAIAIAVTCWAIGWMVLSLRVDAAHSRIVAAMTIALGTALAALPYVLGQHVRGATGAVVVTAVAAVAWGTTSQPRPAPMTQFQMTALVPLVLTVGDPVDTLPRPGGALAPFGEGFLLVSGSGSVFRVSWQPDDNARVEAVRLPLPPLPFGGPVLDPALSGKTPLLRATGIAVDTTGPRPLVFVAHERWRDQDQCLTMAVSATELDTPGAAHWKTIYTSNPCLQPEGLFDRLESGGRMVLRSDGKLLLSLGDFGLIDREAPMAQRADTDYGKVLLISRDGSREVWSRGHRNPQGIQIDSRGHVWSTEHGPQGGDELNLLLAGRNYGWPFTTYGTSYGSISWDHPPPDSTRMESPVQAFLPSIGISNLIQVRGAEFGVWSGDLLVASLRARSLYRIRLDGNRVAYRERIQVGSRIRDLAESADGGIVLWTDDQTIMTVRVGQNEWAGAVAYQACTHCHSTGIGPSIFGVVGRPVAAEEFPYSSALRRLGGAWTVERLDAFLRDPAAFAPGTSMDFPGIKDDSARSALIRHLEQFR